MEDIEGLNVALENHPGTLIFFSHDREFVASLATRVIEVKGEQVNSTPLSKLADSGLG